MSRLGEVVAHGGSTVSQIPLQGFPSPVYPALHEHLYEPTVFWQTELTSQEWEPVVHSSKSKKEAHRGFLSNNRTFLVNEACLKRLYCGAVG